MNVAEIGDAKKKKKKIKKIYSIEEVYFLAIAYLVGMWYEVSSNTKRHLRTTN